MGHIQFVFPSEIFDLKSEICDFRFQISSASTPPHYNIPRASQPAGRRREHRSPYRPDPVHPPPEDPTDAHLLGHDHRRAPDWADHEVRRVLRGELSHQSRAAAVRLLLLAPMY